MVLRSKTLVKVIKITCKAFLNFALWSQTYISGYVVDLRINK